MYMQTRNKKDDAHKKEDCARRCGRYGSRHDLALRRQGAASGASSRLGAFLSCGLHARRKNTGPLHVSRGVEERSLLPQGGKAAFQISTPRAGRKFLPAAQVNAAGPRCVMIPRNIRGACPMCGAAQGCRMEKAKKEPQRKGGRTSGAGSKHRGKGENLCVYGIRRKRGKPSGPVGGKYRLGKGETRRKPHADAGKEETCIRGRIPVKER